MENVLEVASYLCSRYQEIRGEKIDEMKLHKLMYFAQRESLIQTGEPLFEADFQGWKFGPVLVALRKPYQEETFPCPVSREVAERLAPVMNVIFSEFAQMDSFSLARLSHSEISWRKSRKGIAPMENSYRPMVLEDIRLDAQRIRDRREILKKNGIL